MSTRLPAVALCAIQFLSLAPATLAGQALLRGSVRQDSTGTPLFGVEVIAEGAGRQTTTDRLGRWAIKDVPYGPHTILFRQIGYRPVRRGVLALREATPDLDILLIQEGAQRLEPIMVKAAPEPPRGMGVREGFEERRRMGFGKFIDSTFLRANEHRRIADLLRGVPGMRLVWYRPCEGARCQPPELYAKGTRETRSGSSLAGRSRAGRPSWWMGRWPTGTAPPSRPRPT